MAFNPETDLALIPHEPGVYLMKGADGEIFYVGKAANLSKRLSQYFGKTSTATAVLATIAKQAMASPMRVPISTTSLPANLRAKTVCTASGDRIGLMSMGWIVASQSMAALGPMWPSRFLCDTRPRRVVRVLPSNATFANAACMSSIRSRSTDVVRSYGMG